MIPEKVLVTIQYVDRELPGDYELPAKVPVGTFKQTLVDALVQSEPSLEVPLRSREQGLFVQENGQYRRIPEEDTLARHGIWDGSRVTLLPLEH